MSSRVSIRLEARRSGEQFQQRTENRKARIGLHNSRMEDAGRTPKVCASSIASARVLCETQRASPRWRGIPKSTWLIKPERSDPGFKWVSRIRPEARQASDLEPSWMRFVIEGERGRDLSLPRSKRSSRSRTISRPGVRNPPVRTFGEIPASRRDLLAPRRALHNPHLPSEFRIFENEKNGFVVLKGQLIDEYFLPLDKLWRTFSSKISLILRRTINRSPEVFNDDTLAFKFLN